MVTKSSFSISITDLYDVSLHSPDSRLEFDGNIDGASQHKAAARAWTRLKHVCGRFEEWKRSQGFVGWRFTLECGAYAALTATLINLIALVVFLCTADLRRDGRGALLRDTCSRVQQADTSLHFYINIVSGLFLGASNFSMQCLCAPTRLDIDRAHRRQTWLDIGVPSFRNLRFVARPKVILWWSLVSTSLALHLTFNAAIFSTTRALSYDVYQVSDTLVSVFPESHGHVMWNNSSPTFPSSSVPHFRFVFPPNLQNVSVNDTSFTQTQLTERSAKECMGIFGRPFVSDYSFVFLSVRSTPAITPELEMRPFHWVGTVKSQDALDPDPDGCAPDPYKWICDGQPGAAGASCNNICDISNVTALNNDWTPFDGANHSHTVERCWTPPPADGSCKLEINWHFLIIVAVFTLVKTALLFAAMSTLNDAPILTIGDAVASFLSHPDPTTQQMPFLQKADMNRDPRCWSASPKFWVRQKLRRITAANSKRLVLFMVIYAAVLGLVAFGLMQAVTNTKSSTSLSSILGLGIGAIDSRTLITDWRIPQEGIWSLWLNALAANFAQPVLSSCYFFYNSLLTNLLLANEWDRYGASSAAAKGLRVSGHPQGAQRSTHFLQLPLRFAVPLLASSTMLHWLASQSIFVVSVELDEGSIATCGFSPPAMIALVAWTVVMLAFPAVYGAQRFNNGLPVAGSCSAAISAACHQHWRTLPDAEFRKSIELLPVRWGVLDADENQFYCGFSDEETELPDCSMDFAYWARKVQEELENQCLFRHITDPHQRFQTWHTLRGAKRLSMLWNSVSNLLFLKWEPQGPITHMDIYVRQIILSHLSAYTAEDLATAWFTATELWDSLQFRFGQDASAREAHSFWHWFLFVRRKQLEMA